MLASSNAIISLNGIPRPRVSSITQELFEMLISSFVPRRSDLVGMQRSTKLGDLDFGLNVNFIIRLDITLVSFTGQGQDKYSISKFLPEN